MQNLTELVEGLATQNQCPNPPQCLQLPPPPRHNILVLPRHLPLRDLLIQPRRAGHIEQVEEATADQGMRVPRHHAYYDRKPDSKYSNNQGSKEYDSNEVQYQHDRRRPQRRPHNNNRERYQRDDIKLEISEYDGKSQGNEFIDWLIAIEHVFYYKEYSDEKKVKLVAIKLRGYASLWWVNLKRERELEGKTRIRTWEGMKRELHKQFLQEAYEEDSYLKFHSFR
nr:uncharacterized protein LOC117276594 [Nicotiana tomentosiformis]